MFDQPCPHCGHHNSSKNQRCSVCGDLLRPSQIIINNRERGITLAGHTIPATQIKRVGASLALSLTALLAEATISWLRRRVEVMQQSPHILPAQPKQDQQVMVIRPPVQETSVPERTVTVVSERIIETHRWGRPVQRVVQRFAWQQREGPRR